MNNKIILTGVLVAVASFGQCAGTMRYFLSYADRTTVDLARRTGNDPLAAIGREIPTDRPFVVPAKTLNGGKFKVNFGATYVAGDAPYFVGGSSLHLSFDRTTTNDGPINPPLDDTSFRKLFPADQNNLLTNFSNFAPIPAYVSQWPNFVPLDRDGDGLPDNLKVDILLRRAFTRAVETGGGMVFSKPIGLGGSFGLPEYPGGNLGFFQKMVIGTTYHYFDVEWANDLAAGESYGFAAGETGLDIHTPNAPGSPGDGVATWSAPDFGMTFIGARYNLVAAVPEPATLLALSAGMLALRRKRK